MNVPRSSPPAPSPVDHIRKLLHAKSLFTARRFPAFAMLHAQTTDRILLQMSRMHCVTMPFFRMVIGKNSRFVVCFSVSLTHHGIREQSFAGMVFVAIAFGGKACVSVCMFFA